MIQEFDAIAFEKNCAAKFEQSQKQPIEISSQHNYTEGITYYYVHSGVNELGHYYRDAWGYGWVWQSYISGTKANCVKRETAISNIRKGATRKSWFFSWRSPIPSQSNRLVEGQ